MEKCLRSYMPEQIVIFYKSLYFGIHPTLCVTQMIINDLSEYIGMLSRFELPPVVSL